MAGRTGCPSGVLIRLGLTEEGAVRDSRDQGIYRWLPPHMSSPVLSGSSVWRLLEWLELGAHDEHVQAAAFIEGVPRNHVLAPIMSETMCIKLLSIEVLRRPASSRCGRRGRPPSIPGSSWPRTSGRRGGTARLARIA